MGFTHPSVNDRQPTVANTTNSNKDDDECDDDDEDVNGIILIVLVVRIVVPTDETARHMFHVCILA